MTAFSLSRSVFVLVALTACEMEAFEAAQTALPADPGDATTPSNFHAAVGAPIDAATAKRWIENYRQADDRGFASTTIQAATLRRIQGLPGCVGVSLYYGLDDAGAVQIFPIGTDGEGRAIAGTPLPAEATRWIRRYTGPVKSHFFGRDTFTRLLDERRSEIVRVTPALDDDQAPQLLLSDAAETEPRIYEDESFPVTEDAPLLPSP